jgi:hypothetical protein
MPGVQPVLEWTKADVQYRLLRTPEAAAGFVLEFLKTDNGSPRWAPLSQTQAFAHVADELTRIAAIAPQGAA